MDVHVGNDHTVYGQHWTEINSMRSHLCCPLACDTPGCVERRHPALAKQLRAGFCEFDGRLSLVKVCALQTAVLCTTSTLK